MSPATDVSPRKRGKSILLGGALAFVCAVAGFIGTSGLVPVPTPSSNHGTGASEAAAHDFEYVPIDTLTISIGNSGAIQHLKFTAQLEVVVGTSDEVKFVMPRIVDVINGFLRAVEVGELADPSYLTRLRSLLLRRIEIVVGPDIVRNLLVMEFVLN